MTADVVPALGLVNVTDLLHLDARIDAHEGDALRARWEFGRLMLAARDGKGRLPNRFLADLVERTGKSRAELSYRRQFAAAYPTETELFTAVNSYKSWTEIRDALSDRRDLAVSEPGPVPAGTFTTIVADPPWQYGDTWTRGAAANHYATLSTEEICAHPVVPDHAADRSHCYLWTTTSHLPDALRVMAAWGFEYKTQLTWVKTGRIGMGHHFRIGTEHVLFGTVGGLPTQSNSLTNWFEAPRGRHSQKPEVFFDLVEEASPGPFLEVFARCTADQDPDGCSCSRCRLGWTVWGDQA